MMSTHPISRKENLVVQDHADELMIYDLLENKAFCLNQTCAIVWQLCSGQNSVSQISKQLSEKMNAKTNEDLVWLALEQLKKEKLIENAEGLSNPFSGMNRREVIRKVGLGSMVALPVIASLIAPASVHSASCLANGQSAGTVTSRPLNCGNDDVAARNALCASQNGAQCCSGNATATSCNPIGGGNISIGCSCAA